MEINTNQIKQAIGSNEADVSIGLEIGQHAANEALQAMARICSTVDNTRQGFAAALYASGLMITKLLATRYTQPNEQYGEILDQLIKILQPSMDDSAKRHKD